jgi:hypothetical protein
MARRRDRGRSSRRIAAAAATAGLALVLGNPVVAATEPSPVAAPVAPAWQDVGLPSLQPDSELHTVAADDARSAWAIGSENRTGPGTTGTQFTLRWDGSSWQRLQGFPEPGSTVDRLAAASPQDVWAYGVRGRQEAFVAWRWTGSMWQPFALPFPGDPFNGGIARQPLAVVPGAAWIINGDAAESWAWRWDGATWTRQSLGSVADILVQAVTARTANDAWVVGSGQNDTPAVRHWDGTAWRAVPTAGLTGALLFAFAGAGQSGTVWAIGATGSGSNGLYAAYWNGARWRTQTLPVTGLFDIEAMTGDARGRLWVAARSDRAFQSMYLHYQHGR